MYSFFYRVVTTFHRRDVNLVVKGVRDGFQVMMGKLVNKCRLLPLVGLSNLVGMRDAT